MTGSLIRKFIQVQATNGDDWLDLSVSRNGEVCTQEEQTKYEGSKMKLESFGKSF